MKTPFFKTEELEIKTSIIFSSAHITQSDNDKLTDDDNPLIEKFGYGYRIYVPTTDCISVDEYKKEIKELLKEGYSREFCRLLLIARSHNANSITIDCDGTEYEKLPTFNW